MIWRFTGPSWGRVLGRAQEVVRGVATPLICFMRVPIPLVHFSLGPFGRSHDKSILPDLAVPPPPPKPQRPAGVSLGRWN